MNSSNEIQSAKARLVEKFRPFGRQIFDYYQRDEWEQAQHYFRDNFDLTAERVRLALHQLGQALNDYAFLNSRFDNIKWAEKSYNFALMIHMELLDPYNPDAGVALWNMGLFLRDKKDDLDGSFDYLAQALEVWKTVIKNRNEPGYLHYLASCLNALGGIFAEKGEYAGAMRNLQQALELRKNIYGEVHPEVAQSYGDLGVLYLMMELLPEAKKHLTRAFEIYQETLGMHDPMTQSTYNMLQQVGRMMD